MFQTKENILNQILKLKERNNEQEEKQFLDLIDQIHGHVDLETARLLMKTFTNNPDYGTQESVIGALSSAGDEIFIQSMLEELPRLIEEAPEWVESLVGLEINKRGKLVEKICADMPENIKKTLRELCSNSKFSDFYPAAKRIVI